MAEKNVTQPAPAPETNETFDRARGFWAQYSKPIIYIGGAIILAIVGWYAYQGLVVEPREDKANAAIFRAENLFGKMAATGFNKDSVNIVMNGGELEGQRVTGILSVIRDYGSTEAGNRANYIAGATYLQVGDFQKAINYLEDFDANGASQVACKAQLMLGHAYAELNKSGEALDHYKKAATINEEDEFFSADALMTAALYAESLNKNEEAIDLYEKVKDKYPTNTAVQNGEVAKHLAKLGKLD